MTDHLMVKVERIGIPVRKAATYPSNLLIGEGTLPNGRRIRFAGEREHMLQIASAMQQIHVSAVESHVTAVIEDWQIITEDGLSPRSERSGYVCMCGHALEVHERPAGPDQPWGGCYTCACREAWVEEMDRHVH